MLTDKHFEKNEVSNFIKDIVPNKLINADRKKVIELQFKDINLALIQKNESVIKKIKKFLDFTLFEF